MSQFYVQLDERNKVQKMARKLAEGDDPKAWLVANVPTKYDVDFATNFDLYTVKDGIVYPNSDPDVVTIDDVNDQLAKALDTITAQSKLISEQSAKLTELQDALVEATKAQVEAGQKFDQKTEEYQQTFVETTKQIMSLQADVDALKGGK